MPGIPRLANLAISLKNGVALLKYDRPKAGNALNVPLIQVGFPSVAMALINDIRTFWPGSNGQKMKTRSRSSCRQEERRSSALDWI